MGIIRTQIELRNPSRIELSPVQVDVLVDTGALHLCIPEHLVIQLCLQDLEKR
jgi:hypothetical protein